MARRYTIRDIARLAGVSKTTVSRVLHHKPDVHPATRHAILRIMAERGFIPNAPVPSVASSGPRLIGVAVPSLSWPLTHEIVQGVAEVLEPRAYELVVCSRMPTQDCDTALDALLGAHLVAGLVVIRPDTSSPRLTQLSEQGFPLVLLDYHDPLPEAPRRSAELRASASHVALALPALVPRHDHVARDWPGAHARSGSRLLTAIRPVDENITLPGEIPPPFTAAASLFREMGRRAAQLLLWQAEATPPSSHALVSQTAADGFLF
jgi:DNA-binding LacI/PurR family transcriptional regulator